MNPPPPARPYLPGKVGEPPVRDALAPAGDSVRAAEVDGALIRRMRSGDERALGEFYDRWFPLVNGLIARMLTSADDVEDVVEETFWQAWRQADRFDVERGSAQTWLLTIARSRALDRLRASKRRREESLDDAVVPGVESDGAPAGALESSSSDPSLDVELDERRRFVLAALSELPREQREALELGYFGGLSQSEIAQQTGQPLGTVKTRMRLAMQKLRERLSVLREDAR
jgi:RNA polymerase sigma-70 factor (ECF subfamily)